MAVYYVLGSILVVWALVLSALGITRPDFPPSGAAGRALVGVTVAIVLGALVALLATTHVEHPREDAAAEAAVKKAEQKTAKSKPGTAPGKQVKATEKEFSISLASGSNLTAGNYT